MRAAGGSQPLEAMRPDAGDCLEIRFVQSAVVNADAIIC
jgi:hypothetical protein